MTATLTQVRRAGLGIIVAAFSIGVVATSSAGPSGTAIAASHSSGHAITSYHVWGN